MTCTICGNPLPCSHSGQSATLLEKEAGAAPPSLGLAQHPWRNEVIARVRQHRARRGKVINSMEFDFPAPESLSEEPWPEWEATAVRTAPELPEVAGSQTRAAQSQGAPKIIRFPVPPFSRLPVQEQELEPENYRGTPARIVDAEQEITELSESACAEQQVDPAPAAPMPQQMELPCFDDIQLESDTHKALEIEEPVPQAAPLGRRALAGAADLGLVLLASLAFRLTFTNLAEDDPHSKAALLCAGVVTATLWMLYQYLFLVHGKRTPGMVIADLELATFGGDSVSRKSRRARALATAISTFSLGLGFAWALIDEDQLGWHDRMTGTVVKEANSN
jgi:uncharacterized RDD family membrane protein YckC